MQPMRFVVGVVFSGITTLASCAHTPPSRWLANGAYTICKCDGTERQPTPSEAQSFGDRERVDVYCEGKVRDCRLGKPPPE